MRKIVEIIQAGDWAMAIYAISIHASDLGFPKDIHATAMGPGSSRPARSFMHILVSDSQLRVLPVERHVPRAVEGTVTNYGPLLLTDKRFATDQSSWLEPRKIREMTHRLERAPDMRIWDAHFPHSARHTIKGPPSLHGGQFAWSM